MSEEGVGLFVQVRVEGVSECGRSGVVCTGEGGGCE